MKIIYKMLNYITRLSIIHHKSLTLQLYSVMVRKLFLFSILAMALNLAWAIPAKRRPFTVTNSDGTQLTIVLCGDEHFHFHTTEDGVPVVQQENGDWHLAPHLSDSITTTWTQRMQRANARREARATRARKAIRMGEGMVSSPYTGKKKGIVILANFQDRKMKSNHTNATFHDAFNKVGYNENNHAGSVRDYFYDQSYGKLELTFDVFGPVNVSHGYAFYGKNDRNGDDQYAASFIAEACKLADKNYDINWGDYDWDGDGEVDQVYVIYAGIGEHANIEDPNAIWPHEFSLEAAKGSDGAGAITLGGKTINTYATSCELNNSDLTSIDGIGTACHEFSHCLGLPDTYDTSYQGGTGMNHWGIMDAGSYNGKNYSSECPAAYTAFERWCAGWLEFTELNSPATITNMADLQDKPEAYIIRNDNDGNEFFTIENRQNKKWNKYVEIYSDCHGMMICHIDYNKEAWKGNTVNNVANHQRFTFIPAGKNYGDFINNKGKKSLYPNHTQFLTHLFPGNDLVTEFTDDSHVDCGGKFYNPNSDSTYAIKKPITNITESAEGLISFDFMGGGIALDIEDTFAATSSESVYFTLGGILIDKPSAPGIYIMRKGNETKKVIVY